MFINCAKLNYGKNFFFIFLTWALKYTLTLWYCIVWSWKRYFYFWLFKKSFQCDIVLTSVVSFCARSMNTKLCIAREVSLLSLSTYVHFFVAVVVFSALSLHYFQFFIIFFAIISLSFHLSLKAIYPLRLLHKHFESFLLTNLLKCLPDLHSCTLQRKSELKCFVFSEKHLCIQ